MNIKWWCFQKMKSREISKAGRIESLWPEEEGQLTREGSGIRGPCWPRSPGLRRGWKRGLNTNSTQGSNRPPGPPVTSRAARRPSLLHPGRSVRMLRRVRLFVTHGLQPTRLLCPWDSPGKNTGVGCHALLQGTFPIQGSNPRLLHCRQILYHLIHEET